MKKKTLTGKWTHCLEHNNIVELMDKAALFYSFVIINIWSWDPKKTKTNNWFNLLASNVCVASAWAPMLKNFTVIQKQFKSSTKAKKER